MNATIDQPSSSGVTWSRQVVKVWLPIGLFGVIWADLARQLSYTWQVNEQYAFGWFVPILGLAMFLRRWQTRPTSAPQISPSWLKGLVAGAALFLLPLRVTYEINPDWPLCSWLMALIVVGISLYAVFIAGGLKWVRHFWFPICFILIAVQWPYRIEKGLTQDLMRVVAGLTVELLSWFNIPALQHGNLIDVGTGVVGISEACSGIRSFQSTLMAALFMGELYNLRSSRRLLLLAGGVVTAFCLNICRTFVLAWHASVAGITALESWHDPAGMIIFLVSFAGLWAMAVMLQARTEPAVSPRSLPFTPFALLPLSCPPRGFLLAIGGWSLCILVVTEVWYRAHESKNPGVYHWSVILPEANPTFQKIELAPRTLQLLAFDAGATGEWQQEDGSHWTLYFFRWMPRSIGSVITSRIHRPDRCLPAAGLVEVATAGIRYFAAGKLQLPFRRYTYTEAGKPLFVFFCQWEDGSEKQLGMQGSSQSDRLRSVLVGRRVVGNQNLELLIGGYTTLDEADRALEQSLPAMIRADDQPPAQRADLGKSGP